MSDEDVTGCSIVERTPHSARHVFCQRQGRVYKRQRAARERAVQPV